MLRSVDVTRYVTPLREGGSLPALVEADDDYLYVLKFYGAGQGSKVLIAEMLGCLIAKKLGLHVPEIVFANLREGFGRMERDEEIQDLLKASVGLNLAVHFLSGATTYDPSVHTIDSVTASKILWLDMFLKNVDRTTKNTNLLLRYNQLWVIDHGASLYFHHGSSDFTGQHVKPFPLIKDHVLIRIARDLDKINTEAPLLLTDEFFVNITNAIPEIWFDKAEEAMIQREAYLTYFRERMKHRNQFLEEIYHAGAPRF